MKLPQSQRPEQGGFTIVELMIALVVLATLLITATVVLIHLGNLFSKGTNEAHTQNATRNLMSELIGQIKLGNNDPTLIQPAAPVTNASATDGWTTSGLGVLCIGDQRYTYVLNSELISEDTVNAVGNVRHILWRDKTAAGGSCSPASDNVADFESAATPSSNGTEILPSHARLVALGITPTGTDGTYIVTLTIAYGDGDLITYSPYGSSPAPPADPPPPYDSSNATVKCNGGTGDPYCAAASLTGIATQRVQ
jgi:prepilin-type N-terminal cleavage/methylation domain-containing protein